MPSSEFRIAHILPWSSVGGTEQATLRITKEVSGQEFKHIAFCHSGPSAVQRLFANEGIETVNYEPSEPSYRHGAKFLRSSVRLAREFKKHEIDLVHCADLLAAYYAGAAGKMARLPVLSHVRCSYPEISRRDRSFLLAVNKFAFVSKSTWDTFGYHVPKHRGTVVYDGVEIREDSADEEDQAKSVQAEFKIPADMTIVGMISRVAPAKDFSTLAKAAAQVVAQYRGVRFLIVGDHSEVPLNREHYLEVKRMLADLNVAPYFIFTDHRSDISRFLRAMDLFVLSTHTEGLPLVILEAMAHAKPVLATAVGGVPELVEHEKTGLLHEHGNHQMLANQLLSLLRDRERGRQLGREAQRFVKNNFTETRFAAGMTALYREMLGRDLLGDEHSVPQQHSLTTQGEIRN